MRWARESGRFYISRSRGKSSYGGSAAGGSAGTASPSTIWSTLHPKSAGVCDRCGGELYQRDDDTEATSRRRVQVYNDQTAPLISYYQAQGSLIEIDGEQPIEQVGQQMADSLKVLSGQGASR